MTELCFHKFVVLFGKLKVTYVLILFLCNIDDFDDGECEALNIP